MSKIEYNDPRLKKVVIEKFISLLRQHDWNLVQHPNENLYVAEGPKDDEGKPIKLAISKTKTDLSDLIRLSQVINTFALVENMLPEQVLEQIIESSVVQDDSQNSELCIVNYDEAIEHVRRIKDPKVYQLLTSAIDVYIEHFNIRKANKTLTAVFDLQFFVEVIQNFIGKENQQFINRVLEPQDLRQFQKDEGKEHAQSTKKLLESILESFKADPQIKNQLLKALKLFLARRTLDAKTIMQSAIKSHPISLGILHNALLDWFYKTGQLQNGIEGLRFILSIDPEYLLARENLAMVYLNFGVEQAKKGNIQEGVISQQVAITLSSSTEIVTRATHNLSVGYTLLGQIAAQNNRLDLAVNYMVMACIMKPSETAQHNAAIANAAYGAYLLAQKKPSDAVEYFQHATDIGLVQADILNDLGISLALSGHLDKAILQFYHALELEPGNQLTKLNLELAQRKVRELFQVRTTTQTAFTNMPTSWQVISNSDLRQATA